MRICLLGYNEKFFWAGSATLKVQNNVHNYLNTAGIECDLFICSNKKNYLSVLFEPLQFNMNRTGKIISGGIIPFIKYLREEKYDILHMILTRNYMVFFALLSFLFKSKIVATFHDTLDFQSNYSANLIQLKAHLVKKILLWLCDVILVYNEIDLELLQKKFPNQKIRLIKNAIEPEIFDNNNKCSERSTILFAGGKDHSYKGYSFLQASLEKTKNQVRLLTCGYNVKSNVSKNDLGELAPLDFIKLLTNVRLLVVPSRYDSFSITTLESMAVGTPVVLTKNCGVSKYLKDGEGCFIIEYGDELSLANKIDLLISDDFLWQNMSSAAKYSAKKFTWPTVITDYITHYSELISK